MRLFLFIFLLTIGFLYAQDGFPEMEGNYNDLKFIPPQIKQRNEFTFARLVYNGKIEAYAKNWYTDYPQGDRVIIEIVRRLTVIDIAEEERAIPIHHSDLFNYPMIYSPEVAQMILDDRDTLRLREYFSRGGFWMVDDFWGTYEWEDFEKEIKKIFPKNEIVDLPLEHPIFHTVFDIDDLVQVPNVAYAYCNNCSTWESDGYLPMARGIFDDNGRLMVAIFFNTDIMDAVEWADDPKYPLRFSEYAYKIFINTIVYAMSH